MALAGVKEAQAEVERRLANFSPRVARRYLSLQDGEEAQVRFLEEGDGFKIVYVHSVKKQRKNGTTYHHDVVCLNQDGSDPTSCPGCKRFQETKAEDEPEAKRRSKFFTNVIWRDGPVFSKDHNNELIRDSSGDPIVEKHEDQVVLWTGGITVANQLDKIDTKYKGLTSRDFAVSRQGSSTKTTYTVQIPVDEEGEPLNGGKKTPLSDADKKLAKDKYDLEEVTAAPDPGDFFGNSNTQSSDNGNSSEPNNAANPFMAKRR